MESRTPPSQLREMFSKVEPTDDSLHKKSADVGMDSVGADRFLKEGAGQKTTPAAYTPNPKKHYPNAEDNAAYLAHFDGVDVASDHRQVKKWQAFAPGLQKVFRADARISIVIFIACIWGWKDKPVAAVESREHGLAELVVILSTFTRDRNRSADEEANVRREYLAKRPLVRVSRSPPQKRHFASGREEIFLITRSSGSC